jgi:hypothetical protein
MDFLRLMQQKSRLSGCAYLWSEHGLRPQPGGIGFTRGYITWEALTTGKTTGRTVFFPQ